MLGCCVGYLMSCALISLLGITKVSTNNGCHKDEAKKSFIVHTVGACYTLGRPEIANCLQLPANLPSKLCLCPLITEGLCYVNTLGLQ